MISRVLAADVPAHTGEQIQIAGWLHRRRPLKSMTFLVIRDRSGLAQVVLPAGARWLGWGPDSGARRPGGELLCTHSALTSAAPVPP